MGILYHKCILDRRYSEYYWLTACPEYVVPFHDCISSKQKDTPKCRSRNVKLQFYAPLPSPIQFWISFATSIDDVVWKWPTMQRMLWARNLQEFITFTKIQRVRQYWFGWKGGGICPTPDRIYAISWNRPPFCDKINARQNLCHTDSRIALHPSKSCCKSC